PLASLWLAYELNSLAMSAERQLGRARFGCVFVAYENRAPHRSPATARSGRAHALCLLHRQRVLRPLADEPALRRSPRRRRALITGTPANRRSSRDGGSRRSSMARPCAGTCARRAG